MYREAINSLLEKWECNSDNVRDPLVLWKIVKTGKEGSSQHKI